MMNLIRRRPAREIAHWSPYRDVLDLHESMDRFWNDVTRGRVAGSPEGKYMSLPLDMYTKENEVVVKASLPGVDPKDVDVTIVGHELTIKGETKAAEDGSREDYLNKELRCGSFTRTATLPEGLDTAKADGKFENGVLTLRIPRSEQAREKTFKIKIEGAK